MTRRVPLLCLALLLGPRLAWADQLQCNPRPVAEAALELLPPGSLFIDFCSLCEAKVRVVRVEAAKVVKDCDFEVEVAGEVLMETASAFSDGYAPERARFVPAQGSYRQRIDLAYAYVELGENDFRWMGAPLGLQATVNTTSIQLPADVYRQLGDHPRPKSGPPAPPSAPTPEMPQVQRVFDYYRSGAEGARLAHLVPCLELDLARRSPTRYECKRRVTGPVAAGTEVFAWTDWLVPRGVEDAARIQFVKDGEVRLDQKVPLKGRVSGPIVPATAGAKLGQAGTYLLRVTKGGETLAEVPVEVRGK